MATSLLRARLSLSGTAVVGAAVAASSLITRHLDSTHGASMASDLALGAATVVVAAGALSLGVYTALRPLLALRKDLLQAASESSTQEMIFRAQNGLDRNFNQLRETLYGYGEPRRSGDSLYFGARRINGDHEAVDAVRAAAGGTATVFLDDQRISTNVQKPDGSRAVGTALAPGPARETVIGQALTYRGEADILGEPYLSVYEPILGDGEVIGILYVGVKKSQFIQENGPPTADARDDLAQMSGAVDMFRRASHAQAEAQQHAIQQRQTADDVRRRQEAAQRASAAGQKLVVDTLSQALSRLSGGDLGRALDGAFPDDYRTLKQDFNVALTNLRKAMTAIAENAEAMRQGAGEISQAADDLSRRTEQQAASLEQTAAALDEITATVKQTAEGADRASRIVAKTRVNAEQGRAVMAQTVAAISDIQRSTSEIGKIIGAIDDIAFQTNLLALNAGVEAARAGDAGRGFAVVAQEVRGLAQRAAESAKEIKALISGSTTQVASGVDLVSQTDDALAAMVADISEINSVVDEIARSAREQATGLEQVNTAVNDMDRVTQQNAAMVEQSTAASQQLAQQADTLAQTVGAFSLAAVTDSRPGETGTRRRRIASAA